MLRELPSALDPGLFPPAVHDATALAVVAGNVLRQRTPDRNAGKACKANNGESAKHQVF